MRILDIVTLPYETHYWILPGSGSRTDPASVCLDSPRLETIQTHTLVLELMYSIHTGNYVSRTSVLLHWFTGPARVKVT